MFPSGCRDSKVGSSYPSYSQLAEHVHSHYHSRFLCLTCCKIHFSMEVFLFSILVWIHLFSNHQTKFLITALIPTSMIKFFFKHPFIQIFGIFCLALLTLQQCNVFARNIYQLHISFKLITLNLTFIKHSVCQLSSAKCFWNLLQSCS